MDSSEIQIDRTIIAFHPADGPWCSWDSNVAVRCCDLCGNVWGYYICSDDLGGNFSADPMFCDAENGDYTLDACSPCLPGNHAD